MNYKYVLQTDMFDCGIAALQTIFLQFGKKIRKDQLIKKPLDQGVTAFNLIKMSKKFGLDAMGVKTDIMHLEQEKLPCIAHVIKDKSYFHYIVILKNNKRNKQLVVLDPAFGITMMTYSEFKEITTNIFILFGKMNLIKEKDLRLKKVLVRIINNNKKYIFKALTLSILLIFLSLAFSYYLKFILEYSSIFLKISIIFLFLSIMKNIVNYLRSKAIISLNQRIDQDLSKQFVNELLTLPSSYYQNKTANEMISVVNDIENFKGIVTKISVFLCIDIFVLLFIIIFLAIYNIYYSLVLVLVILVSVFISYKFQFSFNEFYSKMKSNRIKTTSFLIEVIQGYGSIKNLNMENKFMDKLNKNYKDLLNSSFVYNNNSNNYSFLSNLVVEVFFIFIITLSLYVTKEGNLFNVILFGNIFNLFVGFLTNITDFITMYSLYEISVEQILDLFSERKDKLNSQIVDFKEIIYHDVTFKFDKKLLFEGLNLTIKENDKIFLTGLSGVGKTTLFKLLFSHDSYAGKITLDNIDLKYMNKELIQGNITYVSKMESLFNDSIYNNLKLVNNNDMEIDDVLKICELDKTFKSKKIDKNYIIYDNGKNLSSGEKAKLIIARALLRNNKIVIFDESFNEIDSETERNILKNIIDYYDNITIIFISHRLENKDLFNKRYVLEEKKLKEEFR